MIQVIKHGKNKFKGFCKICGCEFTYESDDIFVDVDNVDNIVGVKCPDCRHMVMHSAIFHTSNRLNESEDKDKNKKKKNKNNPNITTFPNEYVIRENLKEM